MVPSENYNPNGNLTAKGVRVLSTEDNVLDIADGINEPETSRRRYCKADSCCSKTFPGFSGTRVKYKVVYQKFGFIHSLQAKITKESYNDPNIWISMRTTGNANNFHRKKGRSRNTYFSVNRSGTDREHSYRPYYSSRRLRDYRYEVRFEAKYINTTSTNYSWDTEQSFCSK